MPSRVGRSTQRLINQLTHSQGKILGLASMVLCAAALWACAGDDGEAAFREASEALAEAQSEAEVARESVERSRENLALAEGELEEALAHLAATETRVDQARSELAAFATDDVVFRAVQLALLENEELRDVAISASVESGAVTLSGAVEDADQRDVAVEVAKGIPGVVSVESEIEVAGAAAEETQAAQPEEG